MRLEGPLGPSTAVPPKRAGHASQRDADRGRDVAKAVHEVPFRADSAISGKVGVNLPEIVRFLTKSEPNPATFGKFLKNRRSRFSVSGSPERSKSGHAFKTSLCRNQKKSLISHVSRVVFFWTF